MSLPITPGRETSEHWAGLRAEVVGLALVLAGLLVAMTKDALTGVCLCGIGAWLLRGVVVARFDSRGSVKAAAARPRTDAGPTRTL